MSDLEHTKAVEAVGQILRVVKALGVVPPYLLWAAAVLAATVYVFASRLNIGELVKEWAKNAAPPPPNVAPPLPIPDGGIPLDQHPMEPVP